MPRMPCAVVPRSVAMAGMAGRNISMAKRPMQDSRPSTNVGLKMRRGAVTETGGAGMPKPVWRQLSALLRIGGGNLAGLLILFSCRRKAPFSLSPQKAKQGQKEMSRCPILPHLPPCLR